MFKKLMQLQVCLYIISNIIEYLVVLVFSFSSLLLVQIDTKPYMCYTRFSAITDILVYLTTKLYRLLLCRHLLII